MYVKPCWWVDVMQAIYMIVASWSAVNLASIGNSFRKAGFIATHIPRRNDDEYDIREED
jgi:hypothetical protein